MNEQDPMSLIKLSEANRLLAECNTPSEVKNVIDLYEGAVVYAKKARLVLLHLPSVV